MTDVETADLRAQLAAAQAQLVEARASATAMHDIGMDVVRERDDLRARLEAVREWAYGGHGGTVRPVDVWPKLAAALSAAPRPEPDGPWAVDLICCDRDDGVQVCATWAEADAFRQSYMEPADHKRSGILHRATPGTRLGYHGRAPSLPAGTKKQPEPPASDEPAPAPVPDLMAALRASVEEAKKRRTASDEPARCATARGTDLECTLSTGHDGWHKAASGTPDKSLHTHGGTDAPECRTCRCNGRDPAFPGQKCPLPRRHPGGCFGEVEG